MIWSLVIWIHLTNNKISHHSKYFCHHCFYSFTKLNFYYYLHIGLWKMVMFLSKTLKWQFWPEHTFESILVYSGSHYEAWFCCQRSVATKKIFGPTKKQYLFQQKHIICRNLPTFHTHGYIDKKVTKPVRNVLMFFLGDI